MTITRSILSLLLGCLVATHVMAAPPKFSSVYTDLAKDCRSDDVIEEDDESDESEASEQGEDVPLICKGYGPYRGYIFFTALHNVFQVQTAQAPHEDQSDDILIKDFDEGMIEWRLADGVPFAVIVRALEADGEGVTRPIGLVVVGLGNHARIQARIPTTKNPQANQQARDAADSGYLSGN